MDAVRAHLASLVEDFRRHATEIAVVEHRGVRAYRRTYGEVAEIAGCFAAELERRGVAVGERVALWGANSAEWIGVFFGCLLRGVIAVPLDAAGTAEFAQRVIDDVRPKLIVGDRELLPALRTDVPRIELRGIRAALPMMPEFAVSDAVTPETPFQIVFTSGTTSEPKGIVHTHRNVLASLEPIEREIGKYRRYERWFHPLRFLHSIPLSHVFGQFMGLWIPAVLAAEVHFAEHLEPARMTELIERERISVLVAVPRVLELERAYLLGRFSELRAEMAAARGLPAWKRWLRFRRVHAALGWKFWAVISGGASLPAELEAFYNTLGFALVQGYGMTETAALVTLNHPFHVGKGTIGKALPGREVKLSDEGEILVRGDMLAGATWQQGAMREREGEWLATGDLAAQEATGELRFLGRKGDVIVTAAGMNVHPADLEAAMLAQPGVRGCAVVACGAEPVAVVLFGGSDEELRSAVERANAVLADYQRLRRVLRWPEMAFPFTSTGKLLKRKIAAWACAEIEGRAAAVDGDSATATNDELIAMIAAATGEKPERADDAARLTEDLRLDSLGRVQLASEIEQRLGVELDEDAVAGVATLGELRGMIAAAGSAATLPGRRETNSQLEAGSSKLKSNALSAAAPQMPAFAEPASQPRYPAAPATTRAPSEDPVYPRWPWTWPVQAVRVAWIEAFMRPLVWLLGAPRVVPALKPLPRGPVLIIANHVTTYDGALVLDALPAHLRRHVACAMSGEMLTDLRRGRNQPIRWLAPFAPIGYWLITALFNVFPLPRLHGFRRSFRHAGAAMDHGYSVLIFPEGTRSRTGEPARFRPGIGLLAQEAAVPVVPVALIGLGAMRSGRERWFRSGKLEVRVGDAIELRDGEEPNALTARLEDAMRRLMA